MATKVWAHRGASAYAPENTIAAFKLALEMGADGIELDVHMTADARIVVIHDDTVDRTSNGTGRVADFTCQELKKLDFSAGMEQYRGARIPTLKEVYGLLKNTNTTVNVEIKSHDTAICEKLIALAREMGMEGRVSYTCFDHYMLLALRKIDPDCAIAPLYAAQIVDPWAYANYLQAEAVHPCKHMLQHPELITECLRNGIDVNLWTLDTPEEIMAAAQYGASAVITNRPDVAKQILGA